MENYFSWLDFVAVFATLLLTVLIGIYFSRKNKTNDDLLLGGRNINLWPVALSVMASYISAVTIVGIPSEVYGYGVEVFNLALVTLIVFPLSVITFVPFFYPMKLTSLFEYLERRFKCKTLRKLVCCIYVFEQVVLTGVILYGPSLVMDTFLGIPTWLSIFGIGILCTLYTCFGGIQAVVWTDALQAVIMIAGMLVILFKAFVHAGGISNAFQIAQERRRLNIFKMNFDIFQRHNFYNFYIGFAFQMFFRSTIHQPQLQRFSSQPTLHDAKKTMIMSVPVTLLVNIITVLTGIGIVAIYVHCDPVLLGKIKKNDHLLPYFVVTEMASIPGMLGLFSACIFSGVLSSISSSINSLTAVTWEDFLSEVPIFAKMNPKHQANVSRVTGIMYGLLCVGLAFSAQYMGTVYSASYQVVGASNAIVTATFIAGMFIRHINASGAKAGAVVGFTTMLTIGIRSIFSENLKEPFLPSSISSCHTSQHLTTSYRNSTLSIQQEHKLAVEWPNKIFTLSYLMYPIVGAIIALVVATVVSYFSGGFRKKYLIPEEYLHPFVRKKAVNMTATNRAIHTADSHL